MAAEPYRNSRLSDQPQEERGLTLSRVVPRTFSYLRHDQQGHSNSPGQLSWSNPIDFSIHAETAV